MNKEAEIFGRYLLGENIQEEASGLYEKAMIQFDLKLNREDQHLLSFCLNHPAMIGFIDNGLVFYCKRSLVRQKLFILCSILETIPEYSGLFLAEEFGLMRYFSLFYQGLKSLFMAFIGIIILLFIYH